MNLNEKLKLCLESVEIRSAIAFELIIEDVEKLQEENKILREALEKISTDTVEVGFYVEPTRSAQIAREAIAKVGE